MAKNVMQLHWVDAETGEIGRKKLARGKLAAYVAPLQPLHIAMQACGSAHHWARVLGALGHRVELPPPAMRTLVDGQLQRLDRIGQRIDQLEREIAALQQQLPAARRLDQVPGLGVLGATALAATLGDGRAWRSGREFSASIGLVPAHTGTGGKVRAGHLSKRGDAYLRTLLIHGARSVVEHAKDKPKWRQDLLARRPLNVAVVALAYKMARTAWAIVAHGRAYQRDWHSARPGSAAAQAAGA